MGKRRSFRIAGEEFQTATALRGRIQAILKAHPGDEPLGQAEFAFMLDVLKLHPQAKEKIGRGVLTISVRSNPPYLSRGFWVTRLDGTSEGWSYGDSLSRPASPQDDFKSAARNAVFPSICRFRDEHLVDSIRCPVTGDPITRANVHVHHLPPNTFRILVERFLSAYPVNLDSCTIPTFGRQAVFRDPAVRDAWISWHDAGAELVLLSEDGHKRYDGWVEQCARDAADSQGDWMLDEDHMVEA